MLHIEIETVWRFHKEGSPQTAVVMLGILNEIRKTGKLTSAAEHATTFDMTDDETIAVLRERYEETARATDDLIMALPSLDVTHSLPEAPWFEQGEWSARRVLLHVLAETAQHAGHADIIRETIDGAKTMG